MTKRFIRRTGAQATGAPCHEKETSQGYLRPAFRWAEDHQVQLVTQVSDCKFPPDCNSFQTGRGGMSFVFPAHSTVLSTERAGSGDACWVHVQLPSVSSQRTGRLNGVTVLLQLHRAQNPKVRKNFIVLLTSRGSVHQQLGKLDGTSFPEG